MRTTGTVDDWYRDREDLYDVVVALREIVLAAGLDEALKWGQPAYTHHGKNIALVGMRRAGAIITFFKGALLEDPEGILVVPGENSRHARYLCFTSVDEIALKRATLETFIREAIELERAGRRVAPLPDEIEYVDELQQRMAADEAFRVAFEQLTPGRRRGYNMHFAQTSTSSTREARITRCTERILLGKGLQDCVCGHSKRPPRCDGTHKDLPQ